MECLDDNAASEFVSGALAASAVTAVETHLAGCRDCRALVAALAGDEADSNAATHKHEKIAEDSQVAKRPTLSIGDRVGRYLVLSSLGAGGMGVVFAAYDPQLDRKVALKLLRANLAGANAKEARTRLKREAQAIAQLNHPNVVGVYDVGTTDAGDVYIAMEFIEGDTLTTWLKRWPRTWREILEVFHQAARGLMAAHSVGLLHRDFKPDNVLVGADGRVRVTDFGLARSVFLDDSARGPITASPSGSQKPADGSPLQVDLTATGTVLGTPRYMPPEQLTGPSIDARADQFSFSVALYEALWGKHPLPGATSVSMLEHGDRAIAPPENSKVPASIVRAVMRGLEKERSKRFPTLSALVHELTPPQQRSPVRVIAAAAIGALLVGGAAAAMMTRPTVTQRVDPPDERAVKLLIDEINRRDQEIKQLRKIIVEGTKDRAELVAVKKALDEAQAKVRELEEKVIEVRAKQVPNIAKAPAIIGVKSRDITDAIQVVQRDIEGCFDEWAERAHLAQPRTAGEPALLRVRDADVVVMLSVTPDGVGYSASAKGMESPSTRLCLESALTQVRYPTGPDALDVRIDIAWLSGNLDMTARIVGHHEAAGSTLLDL
ncbi:MAG: protein kinase [Kofleriaceae bacterium]|nr:protein kinase [Kofleriaceae bacterium]